MRRTIKLIAFVAVIGASMSIASAQKAAKPFMGTIKFALTYEGVEASQASQMPTTQTQIINGNKQKTMIDYGQAAMYTITDGDAESEIIFIDAMGQKFAYRLDKAALAKAKEDNKSAKPTITLSDETKEIAGIKCKKATKVSKDEETGDESSSIIWYTTELGSNDKLYFTGENEGINGVVLGTETKAKTFVYKAFATEIKKEKVKDLEFMIPADAKELTKEEFMKLVGGGGDEE